jgi:hypothetical protein
LKSLISDEGIQENPSESNQAGKGKPGRILPIARKSKPKLDPVDDAWSSTHPGRGRAWTPNDQSRRCQFRVASPTRATMRRHRISPPARAWPSLGGSSNIDASRGVILNPKSIAVSRGRRP